jgi:hypothetical protein
VAINALYIAHKRYLTRAIVRHIEGPDWVIDRLARAIAVADDDTIGELVSGRRTVRLEFEERRGVGRATSSL